MSGIGLRPEANKEITAIALSVKWLRFGLEGAEEGKLIYLMPAKVESLGIRPHMRTKKIDLTKIILE